MTKYKIFRITIGDTLYLCDKYTIEDVKAKANKALKHGKTIKWEDGRVQFIGHEVMFDVTKADQGSKAYIWDKSGNKVKCRRYLVTQHPNNDLIDKQYLGTSFRNWE